MKTIEQAKNEAYKENPENAYFGNGFEAGVKFAQRWIDIKDELPENDSYVLSVVSGHYGKEDQDSWVVMSLYWKNCFTNHNNHAISHWRSIGYK